MKHWILSTLRPLRLLIIVFSCTVLMFTSADPGFALGSAKSDPTEGTVQLNEIEKRAEDVAQGALSAEDYKARSQEGFNEVQGAADLDKMKRPENSQQATTALDQVKKGLNKASGKG